MITNKNIPYYLVITGIFITLKFWYTLADTSALTFLLSPTNQFIEWLTGFHSVYTSENGYYFGQLNIVIDKSCSGFNFWLLSFVAITFLTLKFSGSTWKRIFTFVVSFTGAYILTLFANSSRIIASVLIEKDIQNIVPFNHSVIHETIGIVTNLTFLIIIYLVIEYIMTKRKNHAKPV